MRRIFAMIPVLGAVFVGCNNNYELSRGNIVKLSEVKENQANRPKLNTINLITLEEYLLKATYEDESGQTVPFDADGNGVIEVSDLAEVKSLTIPEGTINSLQGIEKLTDLRDFDASGNPLKHIKLGEGQTLKRLETLHLNNCSLESADLMFLSSLKRFYADNNPNFTCLKITSVQRSRAKSAHTRWILPTVTNMNCK